jgi:tetratricopeptide (TPR) repeat protein
MRLKQIALSLCVALLSLQAVAQKKNVQNAYRSLDKGAIAEAKEYIDLAAENASTSNDVKMHNYRGEIYFEIHAQAEHRALDPLAILKCAESWEAVNQHPKAGKWFDSDELNDMVSKAGVGLFNKGAELYGEGQYKTAMQLFEKIFDLFPLDEKGNLKRSNVTEESVYYNMFFVSYAEKDYTNAKSYLQKLIDKNYQEPKIYSFMAAMYQEEGNGEKALEYITLGREFFEFDVDLIIAELNFHLANQDFTKAEALLSMAVEEDPNNHQLFFALGASYDNLGQDEKAAEAYEEAIAIKPDFMDALYNLAALYYNKGGDMLKAANDISDFKKYDKAKAAAEAMMLKALPHAEAAYEIDGADKNILMMLKELYYRNGNDAGYKEVNDKLK